MHQQRTLAEGAEKRRPGSEQGSLVPEGGLSLCDPAAPPSDLLRAGGEDRIGQERRGHERAGRGGF